ncbi:hypothetical protein Rrhod_0600 [Rhodococcus rhodnii LMG 5362]|uniref:MuF-like minor capsid protein n=1 Tax=Rhodococcus rhodnii LMG 5362 TaxID=1273125 RepID=R7WV82_9NOCA|nr:hypothetical protein Rrhod_0600 [Rhodococcus rhodnii LMG 5362]
MALVRRLWRRMQQGDLDETWFRIAGPMLIAVLQAQEEAARAAVDYVPAVLGATNIDAVPEGAVQTSALVGVAGDGRPVDSLLVGARVAAKNAVAAGQSRAQAVDAGGRWLNTAVSTLLSDTGRAAESVGIAARPGVGYVRMLNPPSCSRCVVLAGKYYRWNRGFRRHPGCDCRHIPARESMSDDLRVEPRRYFESLPQAAQESTFGVAGSQAIRDGADLGQVVNANRGTQTAQVFGRQLDITLEGVTRRGRAYRAMSEAGYVQRQGELRATGERYRSWRAPRLMPETIYRIADDRADALRMLRLYGYLD